jgi:hypothetical protein
MLEMDTEQWFISMDIKKPFHFQLILEMNPAQCRLINTVLCIRLLSMKFGHDASERGTQKTLFIGGRNRKRPTKFAASREGPRVFQYSTGMVLPQNFFGISMAIEEESLPLGGCERSESPAENGLVVEGCTAQQKPGHS